MCIQVHTLPGVHIKSQGARVRGGYELPNLAASQQLSWSSLPKECILSTIEPAYHFPNSQEISTGHLSSNQRTSSGLLRCLRRFYVLSHVYWYSVFPEDKVSPYPHVLRLTCSFYLSVFPLKNTLQNLFQMSN